MKKKKNFLPSYLTPGKARDNEGLQADKQHTDQVTKQSCRSPKERDGRHGILHHSDMHIERGDSINQRQYHHFKAPIVTKKVFARTNKEARDTGLWFPTRGTNNETVQPEKNIRRVRKALEQEVHNLADYCSPSREMPPRCGSDRTRLKGYDTRKKSSQKKTKRIYRQRMNIGSETPQSGDRKKELTEEIRRDRIPVPTMRKKVEASAATTTVRSRSRATRKKVARSMKPQRSRRPASSSGSTMVRMTRRERKKKMQQQIVQRIKTSCLLTTLLEALTRTGL